ncbi:MAG TPA: hypothetical protein VFQ61_18785 [Polyangiaceae bacterium]|nr:hypothetical protein [Polyangiaceae bacterium]
MRKNIQLCGLLLGSLTSFASAGCLRPIGEDPFGTDPATGGTATGCGGGTSSATGGAATAGSGNATATGGATGAGAVTGTGATTATTGGSVNAGGTPGSSGGAVGTGTPTGGTTAAGGSSETGGISSSGGSDSSGGTTSVPGNQCGDGVLGDGEMCCTDEWLGQRINAMLGESAKAVNDVHSCIPRDTSVAGVDLCGTAACQGQAVGCDAVATGFTAAYDSATSKMSGTANLTVTGGLSVSLGLISGSCNFTAVINNLTYSADVVIQKTPEAASIAAENLVMNYTVQMQNCNLPGAQEAVNQVAKTIVEPKIREQLAQAAKGTIQCPY